MISTSDSTYAAVLYLMHKGKYFHSFKYESWDITAKRMIDSEKNRQSKERLSEWRERYRLSQMADR